MGALADGRRRSYAAELPFDDDFDIRTHAARRLWRALNNRAAGPHSMNCRRNASGDWCWRFARSMREPMAAPVA